MFLLDFVSQDKKSVSRRTSTSKQPPIDLPIALSRHDQHNLELKTALGFQTERSITTVDMFLFFPKNLHVGEAVKGEIFSDFHSRLRLAIQQNVSRQESSVRRLQGRLKVHLDLYGENTEPSAISNSLDEIFNESRQLGAVLGEMLKFESRRLKKELLFVTSLSNLAPNPKGILDDFLNSLRQIDEIFTSTIVLIENPAGRDVPVLRLLRQYVHQLYSEFLGGLRQEMELLTSSPLEDPIEQQTWHRITAKLNHLYNQEKSSFDDFEFIHAGPTDTAIDDELHLLKMSQIKKFFQAQMFIDVTRRETLRKFSEPAAAGAAAFAALWAAGFEYISKPSLTGVGFKGVFVICIGVAIYVLKDRLKDRFKALFTRKIANYLPEAEQSLNADGRLIGRVREWFGPKKKSEVPINVLAKRNSAVLTEAERHLPEDILHHKQEFSLEAAASQYGKFDRTIQQILRINVDRYLKHLDDPYKSVNRLDGEGELVQIRSHRVYHFYICVDLKQTPPPPSSNLSLYRVIIDKNGIDRVDAL